MLGPRIFAVLAELALNEKHIITRDTDQEIEGGHDGVVGLPDWAERCELVLLLSVDGTVRLGILPAWDSRHSSWIAVQHSGALQDGDRVRALAHEDGTLLSSVDQLEVDAQRALKRSPSDLLPPAEPGAPQHSLRVLFGRCREHSVVHVERSGHVDGVVDEETVVSVHWLESLLLNRR